MTIISETAYPTLPSSLSAKELRATFHPSDEEFCWVKNQTHTQLRRSGLMITLKTFQQLGYFVRYPDIPKPLLSYMESLWPFQIARRELVKYFTSRTFDRHRRLVLKYSDYFGEGGVSFLCITIAWSSICASAS